MQSLVEVEKVKTFGTHSADIIVIFNSGGGDTERGTDSQFSVTVEMRSCIRLWVTFCRTEISFNLDPSHDLCLLK